MHTTYQIRKAGELVGIFDNLAAVKEFVAANPGAEVKPVVTTDNTCAAHPAYEADNCPACGTSRMGH